MTIAQEHPVDAADNDPPRTLEELNSLITSSKPLVAGATRAVLGEGPIGAHIALVGEQPGDQEDMQGRPFVGPAISTQACLLPVSPATRRRLRRQRHAPLPLLLQRRVVFGRLSELTGHCTEH
jgi:uracil-DNA glycosylase